MTSTAMEDSQLIEFMKEVAGTLGSINTAIKNIEKRLEKGDKRMDDNDACHDMIYRDIQDLKNNDKTVEGKIKEVTSLKEELKPVIEFGNTIKSNRKYLLMMAGLVTSTGVVIGAVIYALEALKNYLKR